MTVPVVSVTAAGIAKPDYEDVRAYLETQFRAIYGDDIYLAPDSQDGQFIAIVAQAIHDCNAAAVAVFNSRSPTGAQGEGLSSIVKLNGIARQVATFSTVDLRIVGEVGTIISNGAVADTQGNRWNLPASVTIPISGEITVTATAAAPGALEVPAGSITSIVTPTRGWQTVQNLASSVPGSPVETDAALRARQTISTSIPATTPLEAIRGAIAALTGVTRLVAYENDQAFTDDRGIPAHSIALVVDGGDTALVAQTIARKKTAGTGTFGSTTVLVTDVAGVSRSVRFSRSTDITIEVTITIRALAGWSVQRLDAIKAAVATWISSLGIGQDVILANVYLPAALFGDPSQGANSYRIASLSINKLGSPPAGDVAMAYNQAPMCLPSNVSITVTT